MPPFPLAAPTPQPTHRAPSYTLIELAVANDPVLRAKIAALPAVARPVLGGKAQTTAVAVQPNAPVRGEREEWSYAEVMRLAGPVVRKEQREEGGRKGRGRGKGKWLVEWMRGRL